MPEGYLRGLEELQSSADRFESSDVLSILVQAMQDGLLPPETDNSLRQINSYLDLLIEQGHLSAEQRNAAGDILSNVLPRTDSATSKVEASESDHGILGQLQKKVDTVATANPDLAQKMQQLLTDHPPTIRNLYQIETWLNELKQAGALASGEYNKILDGFMVE